MKVHERGVLPESNIYFHIPKKQDRQMFLTLGSSGYYFCDGTYLVERESYGGKDMYRNKYGSYLCFFVKDGDCFVYQNGRKITLHKGEAFLLDCHYPHTYGAQGGSKLEIVWVHFDGDMVRSYFMEAVKGSNCSVLASLAPSRSQIIYNNLYNIYQQFDKKKGINDILNNKYLVIIMTEFLLGNSPVELAENDYDPWDDLLAYISENVQKPLRLEDLAERMAMSSYHFIRQFKKQTGYTPHRYVMMARIGIAVHLLRKTVLPIKEVAYTCGFSSEGSFCNAFKNIAGIWPMIYRDKAG
ncbi:MAG: AraC family transcriptional regulator [Treponema sp.]|nr:AraC family transcriptional regulator [Treponema sp.]